MSASTTTRPTTEPTVFGAMLYLTGLIVGKLTKLAVDFAGGFKETASSLAQPNLEKIAQPRKWSSDEIKNIPAVLRKKGQPVHEYDWLDNQKAELAIGKNKPALIMRTRLAFPNNKSLLSFHIKPLLPMDAGLFFKQLFISIHTHWGALLPHGDGSLLFFIRRVIMKSLPQKTDQVKRDLYQEVTNSIIKALEKGTVPWRKPWRTDEAGRTIPFGIPANAYSGHVYNGVNVLLLWLQQMENGYSSSRWLTYQQACKAGGNVKKGECATMVVWYKEFFKESKDEQGQMMLDEKGNPVRESFCVLKHHLVFNVEQCENLPDEMVPTGVLPESFSSPDDGNVNTETYNRIIQMVQSLGVRISNRKINKAFYRPCTDEIVLPKAKYFFTEGN